MPHSPEFEKLCEDAKTRIKEISVEDVSQMNQDKTPFFLIDVRDKEEFAAGCIEKATFLSKGWAEAKIHMIVPDKESKIVLYCGGGNRSALVADNFQRMGYTNVFSMEGGIRQWAEKGHKLSRPA